MEAPRVRLIRLSEPLADVEPGKCYRNARRFQEALGGLYVLGWIVLGDVRLEHAWNRLGEAYVDPTLDQDPRPWKYYAAAQVPQEQLATIHRLNGDEVDLAVFFTYTTRTKEVST